MLPVTKNNITKKRILQEAYLTTYCDLNGTIFQ